MDSPCEELRWDKPASRPGLATSPWWKRALDVTLIVLSLPVVLPLTVLVALLIRCVSAGPVLFKQERVGFKGARFMCFKFRTMVVGADKKVHEGHLGRLIEGGLPMQKMDLRGDPRLIRFGIWLRASGVDEIPQLLNVLRGDMSLVGPRPCLPFEHEKYLPWQQERFTTLPGLTGLWQVSGKNRTTFNQMVRMDIAYARNLAFWLDLKIIALTIPALVGQMLETRRLRKSAARPPSGPVVSAQQANR